MTAILGADLAQLRAERTSSKWDTYPPDVVPAWVAELDCSLAPPIARSLHAAIDRSDTGYVGGHAGVIDAFTGFAASRWGWTPPAAELFPDIANAVIEVARPLLRPDDGSRHGAVVLSPVYPSFFHYFAALDVPVAAVPLQQVTATGGEIDFAGVEHEFAHGAKVLLLSNPHNPTGRVWRRDELHTLDALAQRYGVTVLADEIHAPLTHSGAEFVPYLTVSEHAAATAVAFHSASKAFNIAGLKCGLAVGTTIPRSPGDERAWAAGHFGAIATKVAFTEGGRWLNQLITELEANAALTTDLVAEHLPGHTYRPGQASFFAWIGLPAGQLPPLPESGVAISPGGTFGPGGDGYYRVNIGTSPDNLREIFRRLGLAAYAARR